MSNQLEALSAALQRKATLAQKSPDLVTPSDLLTDLGRGLSIATHLPEPERIQAATVVFNTANNAITKNHLSTTQMDIAFDLLARAAKITHQDAPEKPDPTHVIYRAGDFNGGRKPVLRPPYNAPPRESWSLPDVPPLPPLPKPNWPGLPSLPKVTLPSLPALPHWSKPQLPNLNLPPLPALPAFPKLSLPNLNLAGRLPNFNWLPHLLNNLPHFSWKFPNLPWSFLFNKFSDINWGRFIPKPKSQESTASSLPLPDPETIATLYTLPQPPDTADPKVLADYIHQLLSLNDDFRAEYKQNYPDALAEIHRTLEFLRHNHEIKPQPDAGETVQAQPDQDESPTPTLTKPTLGEEFTLEDLETHRIALLKFIAADTKANLRLPEEAYRELMETSYLISFFGNESQTTDPVPASAPENTPESLALLDWLASQSVDNLHATLDELAALHAQQTTEGVEVAQDVLDWMIFITHCISLQEMQTIPTTPPILEILEPKNESLTPTPTTSESLAVPVATKNETPTQAPLELHPLSNSDLFALDSNTLDETTQKLLEEVFDTTEKTGELHPDAALLARLVETIGAQAILKRDLYLQGLFHRLNARIFTRSLQVNHVLAQKIDASAPTPVTPSLLFADPQPPSLLIANQASHPLNFPIAK